jgi:hypothetical protein
MSGGVGQFVVGSDSIAMPFSKGVEDFRRMGLPCELNFTMKVLLSSFYSFSFFMKGWLWFLMLLFASGKEEGGDSSSFWIWENDFYLRKD